MGPRRLLVATILGAFGGTACSSEVASGTAPRDGGTSFDATPPDQIPPIDLTVWAIQGTNVDGGSRQLDHAKVCVPFARRRGKTEWRDFVPTSAPCTSQVTQGVVPSVLLHGVPADSELIVTADEDGYRPSAFAFTTGFRAEDITGASVVGLVSDMGLARSDDPWGKIIPPGVHPDTSLGDVGIGILGCVKLFNCAALGGAVITLTRSDPGGVVARAGAASGPYYADQSQRAVPGQRETLPGGWTTFVDLAEGDYIVRVSHPHAKCRANGYALGNPDEGYAGGLNEVRVPVLGGHSTPNIFLICTCNEEYPVDGAAPNFALDPTTCLPPISDAGTR